MNKGHFISLRWKIALLIGGVFLFLHSIFSYFLYLEANEEFIQTREHIQIKHRNVAHALTEDSFLVLGQFAESFSVLKSAQQIETDKTPVLPVFSTLDENWQQLQFIWDLEGAVFFNKHSQKVRQWGNWLNPVESSIQQVLKTEQPDYQIICPNTCFQSVLIPVMANSQLIGVFGVSRSFADTVIKFNKVTGSDIGILISAENGDASTWPYKTSVITHAEFNKLILNSVFQTYPFEAFFEQRKTITYNQAFFDLTVFPISSQTAGTPPFFLVIDNISDEQKIISDNLQKIWLLGVISLILSLLLMLVVLFFSLRRIHRLSTALPLLAEQKYHEFREVLTHQSISVLTTDEIDVLSQTAISLSNRLEDLEKEVKSNIFKLVEQGYELANERDFVRQLIDVAPILIITQDINGIILSVNQVVIDEFTMEESAIIGRVFDNYIPQTDFEYLSQLVQLRVSDNPKPFKIDSVLNIDSLQPRYISWIHSVVKPKNKAAIILSLGIDITERKQAEEKMIKMATIDPLTGMNNRRSFQIEFAREIASAKRYGNELALFYLDLDQFKIINDTSGHETGDRLLRQVSRALEEVIRGSDILSRIGGDEFTLIMPNAEKQGIESLANKINERLMAIDFSADDNIYKVSTSIGIAIFPQHGVDEHELLSNADLAMYQAKESGRGQYHVFSASNDYQSRLTRRLYWKDIIEDALKNNHFILLYQPILDIQNDQISHYECLSRIENEDGSYLMPGDFIPFAEELGLIGQLDRMVVKKAIEQHLSLKQQGKDIKLAINLSGRSFNDTTIFDDISELLSLPEVDTQQIMFEITETAAVFNFEAAQSLIKKLKALGCLFALDDFGVGFSSFYYLKHLPVDYVKIDGSFIKQLDSNFEDKVFVKALTDVSQSLGKKTIAEFVENEATLEVLKEFGIDYAQGYHIGKPGAIK